MVTHFIAICGTALLAACMAAGGTGGPRAGLPATDCTLRIAATADGFTLAGAVPSGAAADWTLVAAARDGSVRIEQSGTVAADGEAGRAALPGQPGNYDIALTVTRQGRTDTCAIVAR